MFSQEITGDIVTRVFLIKYGNKQGTCFTVDVDSKQYLITARHIVDGIKDGDSIELMQNNIFQSVPVKLVEVKPSNVDISVIVLPKLLSSNTSSVNASLTGIALSQNLYFLGFPYGINMDGKMLKREFPIPLVKKGICSGIINEKDGLTVLLLDGFNNPGFSGGPVVFFRPNHKILENRRSNFCLPK